jgi:2-dehydropantoate 2-reductase
MRGLRAWEAAMHVLVMGAGGVGGYLGAALAVAGHDVLFVARGAHLEAMRARGLVVRRGEQRIHLRPVRALASPREAAGPIDLVIFAVKCYDLAPAADALRPVVSADTSLLTLQNGIDAPDELAEQLGTGHVLAGTAAIFSAIVEPGVIETAPVIRITLGERSGKLTPRVRAVAAALREAGIEVIETTDVRRALWEKLLLLAPNATITSACGLPMGPIRETAEGAALYRTLVEEVTAVGRAAAVHLDRDAADHAYATLMSLPPETTTSMQRDFAAGHRVELEHITGAVVREAQRLGVPVPAFETLYAVLKARALAAGLM